MIVHCDDCKSHTLCPGIRIESGEAGSGNAPTPAPASEAGSVLPSPPSDAGAPPPPIVTEPRCVGHYIGAAGYSYYGRAKNCPYAECKALAGAAHPLPSDVVWDEMEPPAESKVEELMDVLAKSVDAAKAARKAAPAASFSSPPTPPKDER